MEPAVLLRQDHQGALPGVLHLRAGVPGQGHPHRRRPGRGHRRALHRLRQLRARVQPAGQAGAELRSTRSRRLLAGGHRSPPSWRPAFPRSSPDARLPAAGRHAAGAGLRLVGEVAFGADLVAERYRRLLARPDGSGYIATTCPAVVALRRALPPRTGAALAPDRVARWSPRPGRCAGSTGTT